MNETRHTVQGSKPNRHDGWLPRDEINTKFDTRSSPPIPGIVQNNEDFFFFFLRRGVG